MRLPFHPSRLLLVPIGAGLVLHSLVYDFVCDDAFISFVYSRNFAEMGELTFNPGHPVEGYTNFLWTFLLGVLMKVGAPPEIMSRILGTVFGLLSLVVTTRFMARLRGKPSWWDVVPAAFLAASSGFACWCSGGLETQMVTFFVVLGIALYADATFPSAYRAAGRLELLPLCGVVFALAAMTRPEGVLVFALVVAHRLVLNLIRDRRLLPWSKELVGVGAFVLVYGAYYAWRYWYYGYPFPNTYYVKTGEPPSPEFARRVLENGAFYAWQFVTQSKILFAAPLALLGAWRHRPFGSVALVVFVVYLGYTVKIGGDFMGLWRFVMPLVPLVAVLVALGLEQLAAWIPERARRPGGAGVLAAILGLFVVSQARLTGESLVPRADRGIDRPGYLKVYALDRGAIGKVLEPHLTDEDFSIVGGAGVQVYYGRMRAVDVFGLVSEKIAHEVPPTNPRPGHAKWGPAPRLLEWYDPDFVFHCYDLHTSPTNFRLCGEAGFFRSRGFETVTIHVPGLKERGEYYTFLKKKERPWPPEAAVRVGR